MLCVFSLQTPTSFVVNNGKNVFYCAFNRFNIHLLHMLISIKIYIYMYMNFYSSVFDVTNY